MNERAGRSRKAPARTTLAGAVLMLVGAIVFGFRALGEQAPPSPGDTLWRIILVLTVDVDAAPVVIGVAPPFDTAQVQLVSQSMALSGLRLRRVRTSRANRNLDLVADEPGRHRARIEFEVRMNALPKRRDNADGRPLSSNVRERLLQAEPDIQADAASFESLARALIDSRPATTPLADHFVQHVSDRIARSRKTMPDDALSALTMGRSTIAGRARAAVALLRAGRIPARLVAGVVLDERRKQQPHLWLEAFHDGHWQAYDPEYGYVAEVPPSYVPLRRGQALIAWAEAGGRLEPLLAVERHLIALTSDSATIAQWSSLVDFGRLPQAARATVGLLLMLPLGALVTVFARKMVGVRTYGIFSPALLALSTQFVELSTALVIMTVVAIFGTLGRALLPGTLSRTPRLAIVFTFVAVSMAIGVAVLLHLGRSAESVLVLLPVVVLANLVDRFYAVADESGLHVALTRLAWTAAAAVCCFLLFEREEIGQWLVHHPELHLVTIGLMIWMGAYRGKTLAGRAWFQWLRERQTAPQSRTAPGTEQSRPA